MCITAILDITNIWVEHRVFSGATTAPSGNGVGSTSPLFIAVPSRYIRPQGSTWYRENPRYSLVTSRPSNEYVLFFLLLQVLVSAWGGGETLNGVKTVVCLQYTDGPYETF